MPWIYPYYIQCIFQMSAYSGSDSCHLPCDNSGDNLKAVTIISLVRPVTPFWGNSSARNTDNKNQGPMKKKHLKILESVSASLIQRLCIHTIFSPNIRFILHRSDFSPIHVFCSILFEMLKFFLQLRIWWGHQHLISVLISVLSTYPSTVRVPVSVRS